MQTIIEPNEKVTAFLSTKQPESKTGWRWSKWAVQFNNDKKHVIKHTFSGEVVALDEKEYADVLNNEELKKRRYIVPRNFNEAAKYKEILSLIKLTNPESKGLKTYTILPTTACNARCTYCYEEGFTISTMSQVTAERLVDFICETKHEDKITLAWFGGEPLVSAKTISYVCSELEKRGVSFRSRMTTNASLYTEELIKEAKEVWKLENVQVSLDGDRRDYEERKRYINPLKDNYDTVMQAIRLLADADIKVNLRVNFDHESIGRLKPFLTEMKERFGADKNVSLYLAALYQEKDKPYFIELQKKMFELNDYIRELGINYENREKVQTVFRVNMCMADAMDKSIVIHPDGRFYDCEHMPEGHSWGNIFDGVNDKELFDKLSAPHEIDERCAKCPYLPQCTPFYIKGCPCWFDKCRELMELKTEYELRRIARNI